MPAIVNPIFQTYKLACTWQTCGGTVLLDQAASAGLVLGSLVPGDPSDFHYARCPRCKRCLMKVVEAPKQAEPLPPRGFTKIPTE